MRKMVKGTERQGSAVLLPVLNCLFQTASLTAKSLEAKSPRWTGGSLWLALSVPTALRGNEGGCTAQRGGGLHGGRGG